jgi:hypothetical protein
MIEMMRFDLLPFATNMAGQKREELAVDVGYIEN